MTVLGAHEGEGMVLDLEAEVAGSRSAHMASRGQRVDALVVEVALFFQSELSSAANAAAKPSPSQASVTMDFSPEGNRSQAPSGTSSNGTLPSMAGGMPSTERPGSSKQEPVVLPVMLLSNDNGQLQLARSHGLPAVRLADTRSLDALLPGQPLSASTLRSVLLPAATRGRSPFKPLADVATHTSR